MIDQTGCAGVMIGRGALSAPWLFRDTWSYLTTRVFPPAPSRFQKCQLMRDHFYNLCNFRSERVAVLEFRKRISWYAKHLHPCPVLKEQMRVIESARDFEAAIDDFLTTETSDSKHENEFCTELIS